MSIPSTALYPQNFVTVIFRVLHEVMTCRACCPSSTSCPLLTIRSSARKRRIDVQVYSAAYPSLVPDRIGRHNGGLIPKQVKDAVDVHRDICAALIMTLPQSNSEICGMWTREQSVAFDLYNAGLSGVECKEKDTERLKLKRQQTNGRVIVDKRAILSISESVRILWLALNDTRDRPHWRPPDYGTQCIGNCTEMRSWVYVTLTVHEIYELTMERV